VTLDELQAEVDAWIKSFKTGYFPPLLQLARLVEEVGELSRVPPRGEKPQTGGGPGGS